MTDMQTVIVHVLTRIAGQNDCRSVSDLAFQIGRQPGHDSNHQHSALIRRELLALEKAGRVVRVNGVKPAHWRIAA